jgi:hypothetical protein
MSCPTTLTAIHHVGDEEADRIRCMDANVHCYVRILIGACHGSEVDRLCGDVAASASSVGITPYTSDAIGCPRCDGESRRILAVKTRLVRGGSAFIV